MVMIEEDKKILDKIQNTNRNWKQKTRNAYNNAINRYTEFHEKSLTELIKEANKDEKNKINWKNRKLRNRLMTFRAHLYDKYVLRTAKSYFKRVLVIYKDLEIELHELPPISDKNTRQNPPIYYEDLPTNKKIKMACDISDPIMTAILLFISSSGQAKNETLNLTIKDFIYATKEYHSVEDEKNLTEPEILYKVLMDLIMFKKEMYPDFKFKRDKTIKFYRFPCSDEATRAIVNYLITRNDKIELDKKLFKINEKYFHEKFKEINEKLGLEKLDSGYNRFTSHMLRKFHASNLTKSIEKNDGNYEKGMEEDEVNALQGRTKKGTNKSYFFNEYDSLRKRYIQFSKRLRIYSDEDKDNFKTDEYKELESKLNFELNEKNKIISNIAGENVQLKKDKEELEKVKSEISKGKERLAKLEKEKNEDLNWLSNLRKKFGDSIVEDLIKK